MICEDCMAAPVEMRLGHKDKTGKFHQETYDRCQHCVDKYVRDASDFWTSYEATLLPGEGMRCYNCLSTDITYTMRHANNTSDHHVCQGCHDKFHAICERNGYSYTPLETITTNAPRCHSGGHNDRPATHRVTIIRTEGQGSTSVQGYCQECADLIAATLPVSLNATEIFVEPLGQAAPQTLEEQLIAALVAPAIPEPPQPSHAQPPPPEAPPGPASNVATTHALAHNGDVVMGRVISNQLSDPTVIELTVPGEDAPRLLASASGDRSLRVGETVHVELLVPQQRLRLGKIARPDDLPLTTLRTVIAPPTAIAETMPQPFTTAIHLHQDPALPRGVRYVERPADYYMTDAVRDEIHSWELMSNAGVYVKVRVVGDTGVGKTELGYVFASQYKRPFIKVETGNFESPEEWFGMRRIEGDGNGNMRDYFQGTALSRALMVPRCTILLDEGNRTHPRNSNGIMGVFDDTRSAWIDAIQEWITADPSVVIIMTLNVGGQYSGTHHLDAAMQTRFPHVLELTWLPELEEARILVLRTGIATKAASDLVMIANQIRGRCNPESPAPLEGIVSTRTLIACANKIALGERSPMDALATTILPVFSNEGGNASHRAQVLQIIQAQFKQQS